MNTKKNKWINKQIALDNLSFRPHQKDFVSGEGGFWDWYLQGHGALLHQNSFLPNPSSFPGPSPHFRTLGVADNCLSKPPLFLKISANSIWFCSGGGGSLLASCGPKLLFWVKPMPNFVYKILGRGIENTSCCAGGGGFQRGGGEHNVFHEQKQKKKYTCGTNQHCEYLFFWGLSVRESAPPTAISCVCFELFPSDTCN